MKQTLHFILSLGIVCLVASAALSYVNQTTRKPIEEAQEKALNDSLKLVCPEEMDHTSVIPPEKFRAEGVPDNLQLYLAQDQNNRTIGYAASVTSPVSGFKGPVKVVAGITLEGEVRAVMVTEHSETPGIGTKATDRKAVRSLWDVLAGKAHEDKFPPNAFLDKLNGTDSRRGYAIGAAGQKNPVDAVGGATYSSRSVIGAMDAIGAAVRNYLK